MDLLQLSLTIRSVVKCRNGSGEDKTYGGHMQLDVTLIRIVFIAALVGSGYVLTPVFGSPRISAGVGAVIAVSIIFFETRIRRATLKTLIGGAVGSILGIAGATLIGWIIQAQSGIASQQYGIPENFKTFL